MLAQFDENRQEVERKYREFIRAGIGEGVIWEQMTRRGVLGDEDFAEWLGEHLEGKKDLGEIPRSQRHADRPSLEILFGGVKNIEERNRIIGEAVEKHGYRQGEVAGHIGIHYSTVSKILAGNR